jgi:hypothetical protein
MIRAKSYGLRAGNGTYWMRDPSINRMRRRGEAAPSANATTDA